MTTELLTREVQPVAIAPEVDVVETNTILPTPSINIEGLEPVSPKLEALNAQYGEKMTVEDRTHTVDTLRPLIVKEALDISPDSGRKLPGHDFSRLLGPA